MGLNPKQRLFVNEYVKSRNATAAAKRAGYSKKTAHSQGPRLLENVEIKAAIDNFLNRATEKAELSVASVLAELKKVGFAKLAHAFGPDGALLPLDQMPEDTQAALAGVESDEIFVGRGATKMQIGHTRKVKMVDKIRALELIGKHFKMFTDVTEVKTNGIQINLTMPANGSEADEK